MKNQFIQLQNASKHYKQGGNAIKALNDANVIINESEFVLIMGPSGSGKSTLMQLLGALDLPTSGEIIINSKDITKLKESELAKLRRYTFGYIFQNFNLIPTLTALENVESAYAGSDKKGEELAKNLLQKVGLKNREHHLPTLLSGGEQQRVAIARALINDPKIILADEPTGNLDTTTGKEILELISDLNKKSKKTIIMITHSNYAKKYATRVYNIKDGKIGQTTYNC